MWSATGLPAGVTVNPSTGLVGTPTVAGTYSVTITVTDSQSPNQQATKTLTLNVNDAIAITTPTLNSGVVGSPYNQTLTGNGGTSCTYAWSANGLTAGLAISSSGVITGTPIVVGSYTVVVTLLCGSLSTNKTYTLVIVGGTLTITTPSLLPAQWSVPYSSPVVGTGGTAPYSWTSSGLPIGLFISPTTGVISGTPTQTGTFNVTVRLYDSSGLTTYKNYPLTVTVGAKNILPSNPGLIYNFAEASWANNPFVNARVLAAAKYIKSHHFKHVLLIGYCDPNGHFIYNLGLGLRRAQTVESLLRHFLATMHYGGVQYTISTGGKSILVTTNRALYGQDRRVTLGAY